MVSVSTIISDFWEYRGDKFMPLIMTTLSSHRHWWDNSLLCIPTRSRYIGPFGRSDKAIRGFPGRFGKTTTGNRHQNPFHRAGLVNATRVSHFCNYHQYFTCYLYYCRVIKLSITNSHRDIHLWIQSLFIEMLVIQSLQATGNKLFSNYLNIFRNFL